MDLNRFLTTVDQEKEEFELTRKDWETKIKALGSVSSTEIGKLITQQKDISADIRQILEACNSFAARIQNKGDQRVTSQDIMASLDIIQKLYLSFWVNQPQYKILTIIKNQGEVSVEHLSKATGILGAQVLKTCQELQKAKLIEFDIDHHNAKIINRNIEK